MLNDSEIREILLVDDEEDIREVLAISLKDMGYRVTLAENGQKALTLFETHGFPIVLTDIKMPVMDGIELLKKIKTMAPETEIIMITGHGDMDLAIESFRNQAVEFITKPVDVQSLEIALERAKEKIIVKKHLLDYTHNLERLVLEKSKQLASVDRESSRDLTSIMDTLPMVVFCVDRKLRITSSNTSFKEMFNIDPDVDEINGFCHQICRNSVIPCEGCPALESFTSGKSVQAEVTYTTSRQADVSFLAWASPVEDAPTSVSSDLAEDSSEHGHPSMSRVMIMATDVSRVIDIEDHLKSLGLMIGSVSHGIKGLLTGLDGGLYLLDSALKKENQHLAQEGLDTMKLMTSKIRKLILDILFYTKKRTLTKGTVDATGFVREVIQTVKQRMDSTGILLDLKLPAEKVEFMADSTSLQSAVINILDNAIDACQANKKTKTATDAPESAPESEQKISFTVAQKKDMIEFIIKDTGIGMTKGEIQKAFTLFHSGKEKKGTGLGLFIAEKVISQHGGTIQVESTPNQGTTFYISLPLGID
ncbi:MAG: response regulator [Desulfobacterium sp.]|jgi:signal transduction histidine kinase/FixJ family two-component response regulator|nr:response regulator [Desulfobacterium sp.]